MSTYKLEIDGSGADAGAEVIVKSFDKIKAAADRMEGGVSAAAKKASAAFGDLQKNLRPVSDNAIRSLQTLSSVFKNFKGPSNAAVLNTITFLQGIKSVGVINIGRMSGLSALLSAISGYRGPSPTAGKNTLSLLNALRFAGTFSASRGLATTLTALSGFKGPSASGARNTASLLSALQSFKAPRGLAAVATALDSIANAAGRASGALGRVKSITGSGIKATINTSQANQGINNLIRQQGALQTAILRTQTFWHSLGGIFAAKFIVGAANDLIKIRAQLEAATGSAANARVQFNFLREQTMRLGLDFRDTARSYGFFLGAIKGSNLNLKEAQDVFRGFSVAARALQLSTSDVDGIFRALGQIMSKGKLQAEELRQQLGDRLPGAFIRFARALDMTKPGELDAALKKGAISGDKLHDAILKVASSLENEFARSADVMSKTVDAAFNRLKNSFAFAADELGRGGLNQAIINLFDTLRKFIESSGFDKAMRVLAASFKFLGDNIELVAGILGFVAVNATLKWVTGLAILQKTLAAVNLMMGAMGSTTAVRMALGLGSVAASTTGLGRAMQFLGAVIKANPIFILASVIVGVTAAYAYFTKELDTNRDAMDQLNGKMADAGNFADMYIQKQLDIAKATGDTTNEIWNQIKALNELALRGSMEGIKGYQDLAGGEAFTGQSGIQGPGGILRGSDADFLNRVATVSNGQVVLKNLPGGARTPNRQGWETLNKALAIAKVRAENGPPEGQANFKPLYDALQGRWNALVSKTREPGYKGQPYEKWAGELGDYNRFNSGGGGLSGSPVTGSGKHGGKSEAEKWSEELERNLRSAQKALTDLQVEAASAGDVVNGLLGGSITASSAGAVQAAQQQLKTFEDTFDSVEKAQQGTLALAQQLKGQGLLGDQDISTYEDAKRAVVGYYEEVQKLTASRQKDMEVATNVAKMRDDNSVQETAIGLLKNHATTQADVNKQIEIETQLMGVSEDKRADLTKALSDEIDKREQLKRELEITNAQRDLETQKKIDANMTPLLQAGMKKEDIDYYRELYTLREQLIQQNYTGKELQDRINIQAEVLNQARAMKELEDQYERERQFATDFADAIVGGFQEASQAGKSFLSGFKGIFKELKNIILDFVLFNPLKRFLTDAIQGQVSGNTPFGFTTQKTTSQGASGSPFAAFGSALMGAAGASMQGAFGGGQNTLVPATDGTGQDWVVRSRGASANTGGGPDIVVTGAGIGSSMFGGGTQASIPQAQRQQQNFFSGLKKVFDHDANSKALKDLGSAFANGGKGLGAAIGPAVGAAMNAVAAYSMGSQLGKGFAKMIGGGFRTQAVMGGIAGGAAAGFSLGGPIGAAIGAVAGGILGFMKKKPKLPSSYGSVSVGADGVAEASGAGAYGKGDKAVGQQLGSAAAAMFNQFAMEIGGNLQAGRYGTFGRGEVKDDDKKGEVSFYSSKGVGPKGQPLGRQGVDWVSGSESEVQAFALIQQVKKGMVTGLSDTMKTVFQNTKATSMEALQGDIGIGQAFDQFLRASYGVSELAGQVSDLTTAWKKLAQQAKTLGLSEEKLKLARERLIKGMRDEFNFNISQGILEFTNPTMAAYNDLVKEYRDTVENAIAVGGDLAAVEQYYGLKRADILKQTSEQANNGILAAAKDLYDQLTASGSSPLNAGTVLNNSRDLFRGLAGQIRGGDYSSVDQLQGYAGNYLDAARSMYGSSTDYFDIFSEVTNFLKEVMDLQQETTGSGGTVDIPALPNLDDIVAEVYAKNQEIVDATGAVGLAVAEGSQDIVDAIDTLTNVVTGRGEDGPFRRRRSGPVPTTPTAGGATGVADTGGLRTTYRSSYGSPIL